MGFLLLWIFSSTLIWLIFVHPVRTLTTDVLLRINSNAACVKYVVCEEKLREKSSSRSLILYSRYEFAVSKAVDFIKGRVVVLTTLTPDQHNNFLTQTRSKTCSFNCSTLLKNLNFVYFISAFNFTTSTRQFVFDSINSDNRNWRTVITGISELLTREKWQSLILFSSTKAEATSFLKSMPFSTAKQMSFTLDEGMNINITLNDLYTFFKTKDLNFIAMCPATCIVKLLEQAYQVEILNGKISNGWMVILTEGCAEDLVSIIKDVPLTGILIIEPIIHLITLSSPRLERNDSYAIANLYMLHASQDHKQVRHVGHINEVGQAVVSDDPFLTARFGFNNRTLLVSTLEWQPFVFKRAENGTVTYSGICIDLLKELARTLNFSYKIVEPKDQEWGSERGGRWTGIIGQLAYKEVDLAVAPIAILDSRENVMDFTIPYFYIQSGIILKKMDPNADKWMTLVSPFRYEVHICILSSLIFSTAFLFAVEEVHPINTWTDKRLSARRTRYGDILWYHFGALMANGGAYLPSSITGRTVLSCWWLLTVISAAIYSGNLIAFLTDWREKLPFTSLLDMVEQDTYKWGTLGATSFVTLFQNSKRKEYQHIWNGMNVEPERLSTNLEDHKNMVYNGRYAYLGDETVMEVWNTGRCDLQMITDQFLLLNYAVGLPNNSIYTRQFSDEVLRINEQGLPRIWYKRWSSSVQCQMSKSAKRVDFLTLQSVFYAAGVGVLLALLILLAEIIINKKCRDFTVYNAKDNVDTRKLNNKQQTSSN